MWCRGSVSRIRRAFATPSGPLAEFHDSVWERTGIAPERTVLGGFSMGTAMSYALGLPAERPVPAGILAFSGFVDRKSTRLNSSHSPISYAGFCLEKTSTH